MTLCLVVLLILFRNESVGAADITLFPASYVTWGDHSNHRTSREFSGYLTAGVNRRHFFSVGWDRVVISHTDWDFRQEFVVGGASLGWKKLRLKGYYGHASGTLEVPEFEYAQSDRADLYSLEPQCLPGKWLFGIHGWRFAPPGADAPRCDNLSVRLGRKLDWRTYIQFMPNITQREREMEEWSASILAHQRIGRKTTFELGGSVGKRANFFDNDLLVLSNQPEYQTGTFGIKIRREFVTGLTADVEYMRHNFDGYYIDYFVLGTRMRFGG